MKRDNMTYPKRKMNRKFDGYNYRFVQGFLKKKDAEDWRNYHYPNCNTRLIKGKSGFKRVDGKYVTAYYLYVRCGDK